LLLILAIRRHYFRFYHLMENNVLGTYFQEELMSHAQAIDFFIDSATSCPQLPLLLANVRPEPLVPMTREELENQIEIMVPTNHTGGNLVLQCPNLTEEHTTPCRGVVKVFRSESTYQHVKRCLTILKDAEITARLLYSDEETLTLVEEEIALSTLWEAPIPRNFDMQLIYIRCILLNYSVVHRDFTAPNFVVHPTTGKLYIIDFSDAFAWDDQWMSSGRNLVNLFNIWWKWHDEDSQRHVLVDTTKPMVKGDMQWKRPAVVEPRTGRWEPSNEDLQLIGGRQRFDLLQDIRQ
jgi:hypothetical protein